MLKRQNEQKTRIGPFLNNTDTLTTQWQCWHPTNLFVTEFFSKRGHEVAQFGRGDEAVAVLVEVPETLHEILRRVGASAGAAGLENTVVVSKIKVIYQRNDLDLPDWM